MSWRTYTDARPSSCLSSNAGLESHAHCPHRRSGLVILVRSEDVTTPTSRDNANVPRSDILDGMDVLLVLVGAIAALGGSIVVESYRSRRDRERWRLERRYETYVTALAHVDRLLTWARDQASIPDDSGGPKGGDLHDFAAALALVGSGRSGCLGEPECGVPPVPVSADGVAERIYISDFCRSR